MKTVKILVSIHMIPENNHITVFLLNNLLPALRTKVHVKLFWVVYTPEKKDLSAYNDLDTIHLDIHDFKNAVELLKQIQPDFVLNNEHPSLIDFSFDIAAKFLQIPVILGIYKDYDFRISKQDYLKLAITKFCERSVFADTSKNQQRFFRRGKFFLYKYAFLMKTKLATNASLFSALKYFFIVFKIHLYPKRPFVDSRFSNALHWVQGEYFLNPYLKASGYDKSSFVLTGNPIYDPAFKRMKIFNSKKSSSQKTRILFLPSQHYELGMLTRKERDFSVKEIIKELSKHKDKFSIIVKLHPSSQILYEYEPLVHSIDKTIPVIQKGNVIDFLKDADIVVAFSSTSSTLIYSLIAKKPIILCDFFNRFRSYVLERGLALNCTKPIQIISLINEIKNKNPVNQEKTDQFIEEFCFKSDGNSSQRLAESMLNLLEKMNKK